MKNLMSRSLISIVSLLGRLLLLLLLKPAGVVKELGDAGVEMAQ